jgi:hypothetical protein
VAIYARPYDPFEGNPVKNTMILDAFVAHPEFLTHPYSPEEIRAIGAGILTDPGNLIFETWKDQEFVGVIILTRVVPRVDALLHFLFTDKDLVGKRKLLQNFIGFCFTDLGFNRLSMEVPEGVRIERFARKVLRFRYEGESRPRNPELPKSLDDVWVARQGSRIESGYYDGTTWSDILRLRLLACEWVGTTGEGGDACRYQQSSAQPHQSSVDSLAKP